MCTEIEKAGLTIKEQEGPSVIKLITGLTSTERKRIPEDELFSVILYIRAHFLGIENEMMSTLCEYIKKNNENFDINRTLNIIPRFPKPTCSVDEYMESINNVLFALELQNEVVIRKK